MAKKRRGASAAQEKAAKQDAGEEAKQEELDDSGPLEIGEPEIALALKAVSWLASQSRASGGEIYEALSEAARPLIQQRAAKYEEDAKANKMAEVAAGNYGKAAVPKGLNNKRPRQEEVAALDSGPEAVEGKELSLASRVLRALGEEEAELLATKPCKALRAALHPLVAGHLQEEKASPTFRVTCMLGQKSRWAEARRLLAEMRSLPAGKRPKLGAYQRWVRELNVAEGNEEEVAMLDSVMRVAAGLPPSDGAVPAKGSLSRMPAFAAVERRPEEAKKEEPKPEPVPEQGKSTASRLFGIIADRRKEAAARIQSGITWKVLEHEAAHARKPPNRFDLDIYTCSQEALSLTSPPLAPVARHGVPGVEGAFVLSGVLSTAECGMVRDMTEAIGYRPDVPLSSPMDERAQNVVIMATQEQNDLLFARVRNCLPPTLDGDRLVGLNRRWRLYRYEEGNLYRKHLDGAWPSSGTRTGAGGKEEYVYDVTSSNRSRLTFIIYLNDDFQGGETTFFVPAPNAEGKMEAWPVQPIMGCATVFPHGDTGIPLLHEGSSVAKGRKYLLRTDVVYTLDSASDEALQAARMRALARQLGGLGGKDLEASPSGMLAEREPRRAGQTRKVIKRGLKGGKEEEYNRRDKADFKGMSKPGSKRTSKRANKGRGGKPAGGEQGGGGSGGSGKRKGDAKIKSRAASKLNMVGRLKSGPKRAKV